MLKFDWGKCFWNHMCELQDSIDVKHGRLEDSKGVDWKCGATEKCWRSDGMVMLVMKSLRAHNCGKKTLEHASKS